MIVKLQKRGSGKPAREPLMSEDERKQLMLDAYRRQEQLKVSVFLNIVDENFSDDLPKVRYSFFSIVYTVVANKI